MSWGKPKKEDLEYSICKDGYVPKKLFKSDDEVYGRSSWDGKVKTNCFGEPEKKKSWF